MVYAEALEFIRRHDINRTLLAAGRDLTRTDLRQPQSRRYPNGKRGRLSRRDNQRQR